MFYLYMIKRLLKNYFQDFKDLTPEQIEKYTKEFEIEQEKNIENEQGEELEDE